MDDGQIIGLYFARDEQAITATGNKYGGLCMHLAGNILGSREDAEECVNDTYWSLWNTIPPVRPVDFRAFICKITRNLSLKKREAANAAKRRPPALLSLDEIEETVPDASIPPETGDEELGRLLSDFLRQQDEDARNVFLLRYWFFSPIREIAARYSFSENKVKSMLFRTRGKLRAYLVKEGFDL